MEREEKGAKGLDRVGERVVISALQALAGFASTVEL
jgi:hypothetical protein